MKKLIKGLLMALTMFTIIPMPYVEWDDDGAKNMMKFYPVIGLIVGAIWMGIYYLLNLLNCSIILKSILLMIVPFIITGMLHLDGFMDVCDAILSRRDKEEKLRILKDSATGAFAVVSLVILFFIQFGTMYSFIEKGINPVALILIPIVSRSVVAYLLLSKPTIKQSSLGAYFKKGTNIIDRSILLISLILAFLAAYIFIGYKGMFMVGIMGIAITLATEKCIKEFGGISGDVAGFALVKGEIAGLLILSIIF
ncbi:adenosylcobinamide-GDP ribazoletransferase [Clostridium uliginosum]|uniref:Adenosylcobinamide-GDP ribazoletransferase n=1 Tax=Clostridium uliginosum TaxID=119641 RepID=A0A1I1NYC7_9CLOT|nr:adenosylcobinamide-GDP ribazoletransferase [Clostridium uliginosum]SFD02465.1 adenosylcobinamide-GDP ribazoletransferase [Clostridium uliginosum]